MKHWLQYTIPTTIMPIILLAFPQSLKAQQLTGAFIMSSVGGLHNMSSNSMAISFNSSTTCLNVQNGAAVLSAPRGAGVFSVNCEVNTKFNTLGIKLYPNPVVSITKIKFINTPPLNELFSISIWGTDGFKITSGKATGYEIFQGMPLDFSMLQAGTYIIRIESEKYTDALKFIKAK
jgi:hypothetical protein